MSALLSPAPSPVSGRPWGDRLRMGMLYLAAASGSLGVAVAALGRVGLYVSALAWAVAGLLKLRQPWDVRWAPWHGVILAAVAWMGLSMAWSPLPVAEAFHASWNRYARLLTIPLVWMLIRSPNEALNLLRVFVATQLFVMLSSWLLVFKLPVPWATAQYATETFAVFGSYLEQGISEAIVAGLLWFRRADIFGARGKHVAVALAALTLVHCLGFLNSRTGHLVALALFTLALWHRLSARLRWVALGAPVILAALALSLSPTARDRFSSAAQEMSAYQPGQMTVTSTGLRLTMWKLSLQALADKPWTGHGAGSWNSQFRVRATDQVPEYFLVTRDPHQLFLLWAVEGGIIALALLLAVVLALAVQASRMGRDGASLQAMLLGLVVASLFTSSIYGIGMGDFFCVGLGIALGLQPRATDTT